MLKTDFNKSTIFESLRASLPFILLFAVGLIKTNTLTYHQKVFKTLLIMICAFILIGFFLCCRETKINFNFLTLFFFIYLMIFIIQYAVSFFSNEISYDRDYYLANYIFLIIFSLFSFLIWKDENDLEKILLIIPIFLIILSVLSMIDFYNHYNTLSSGSTDMITILSRYRPALSFGNTNYLAGYLITILPMSFISSLYFISLKIDKNNKVSCKNKKNYHTVYAAISITGTIAGIFPLILTQTTSAFTGLYLAVVFLAVPSLIAVSGIKSVKVKILLITASFLLFAVIPLIILITAPDIINLFAPRLVTKTSALLFVLKDRINGWTPAWNLFLKHPVTGAGLGTVYAASFKYIPKYYFIYSASNSFKHSHNEFIELLAEGGLISFLLFIFLSGFVIFNLLKIFISKSDSRIVRYSSLGSVMGITGVYVQQIFDLSLRMSVTMSAYFTILALSLFIIKTAGKPSRSFNFNRNIFTLNKYIFSVSIIIMMIIGGYLFRPLFLSENSIMKSYIDPQNREKHLEKAVSYMPDNPYVLTVRFEYHSAMFKRLIELYKENAEYRPQIEKQIINYYSLAEKDLERVNEIIPDYQDPYIKKAKIISDYNDFLMFKYFEENQKSVESLIINNYYSLLINIEKSLDINFLNYSNHMLRLSLLNRFDMKDMTLIAVEEAVEAWILLEYGKKLRNVKENIIINFSSDRDIFRTDNKKLYFDISEKKLLDLHDNIINAHTDISLINSEFVKFYSIFQGQ